ncbi:hypothetical protein [Spongorhabdus nitratireducens]
MLRRIAFGLLLAASIPAQAELTCNELVTAADLADFYADDVFFANRVREGSRYDEELSDLVDVLGHIADVEDDRHLFRQVDRLEDSWVDQKWNTFDITLQNITDRLDDLYDRDC